MWSFKYPVLAFLSWHVYFTIVLSTTASGYEKLDSLPLQSQTSQADRKVAIKEAFLHTWKGYQHCFSKDSFYPAHSVLAKNSLDCTIGDSAWGMTAFQALNTAIIMELPEVVEQILDFISQLDFLGRDNKSLRGRTMKFYAGTSKYMGSMLGAYNLLTGQYKDLVKEKTKVDMLLNQTVTLANRLKQAYNYNTGVPNWGYLVEKPPTMFSPVPGRHVNMIQTEQTSPRLATARGRFGAFTLSDIGTIVLDWCHLSDLTADESYCTLGQKTESILLSPKRPPVAEPFPGLLSVWIQDQEINRNTTSYVFDDLVSFNGLGSGYYEYLLKMYMYNSVKFSGYREHWLKAAESSVKHLLRRLPISTSQEGFSVLAMYNDTKLAYTEDESSCSSAGYLILGGQLFSRPNLVSAGQSLLRTCHYLRQTTATGLAPSDFHWSSNDLEKAHSVDPTSHVEYDPDDGAGWTSWSWNYTEARDFFTKHGLWYFDSGNWLSKATPESYYYAYRVTKEQKYRDWAWEEFLAINRTARVPNGFAPVVNVNSLKAEFFSSSSFGELPNDFLSGTLKFLYMIQAEEATWQTKAEGYNEYIFSSNGSPFKAPNANRR